MNNLIIDANVIIAYFKIEVLGIEVESISESPVELIDSLDGIKIAHLDNSGQIEHEWKDKVDDDWFNAWLPEMLSSGKIASVDVKKNQEIEKKLLAFGFPSGRDVWYIRTAYKVKSDKGNAVILTEDIDFYCPKEKGCNSARRNELIEGSLGEIPKYLRKKQSIQVICIKKYNENSANTAATTTPG